MVAGSPELYSLMRRQENELDRPSSPGMKKSVSLTNIKLSASQENLSSSTYPKSTTIYSFYCSVKIIMICRHCEGYSRADYKFSVFSRSYKYSRECWSQWKWISCYNRTKNLVQRIIGESQLNLGSFLIFSMTFLGLLHPNVNRYFSYFSRRYLFGPA